MKSLEVSRRRMLALVGASAVAAPVVAHAGTIPTATEGPRRPDEPMDASGLLAPLAAGSTLGGWLVTGITGVRHGALTLALSDSAGTSFYLDVCAHDGGLGAYEPPARSEKYDIYLSNHGRGADPTFEDHGLAAMALAEILRANENRVAPEGFLTLRERLDRYPDEVVRGL